MNTKWVFGVITLCCILSLCSMPGRADEFEDFIQSCARISKNYKSAVSARDSRYAREYRMYLKAMQKQAEIIQDCSDKLRLGKDFHFARLSGELEQIFWEDKSARIGKNRNISEKPDGVLQILLFDVKELHKMEFTTEENGSIKPSLESKRRLLEMKRLVRFFSQFRRRAERHNDPSLQKEFSIRSRRMLSLAQELEIVFRRQHKNSRNNKSLSKEVSLLLSDHNLIMENARKRRAYEAPAKRKKYSSSRRRKQPHSINRLKKDENPKALEQNIRISLRNIHDILAQWDSFNFSPDRPVGQQTAKSSSAGDKDPSSILKQKGDAGEDLQSMSSTDLHKKLVDLRKEILKGNSSIDGMDSGTERKYLRTLSREQAKIFRNELKKFQDQGYESGVASRNAILRTQFEISLSKKVPEKKELLRIFENLRKDEIRNKGKINF